MVTLLFALGLLTPALLGFATKFREFLLLYRDDAYSFAAMPIINYLLASTGFLLLFGWAIMHGMFRDLEGPKYTMLENERALDEEEEHSRQPWR